MPVPLLIALRLQMPLAFLWALATPSIIWLGRRFPPFEGPRWPRGVAVNLLACMIAVYVEVFVLIVNQRWVQGTPPNAAPLLLAGLRSWVWWLYADGLLYWAVLVIDYQVEHYRELRQKEVRASQIEAGLARGAVAAQEDHGVGLANTSARLRELYGGAASLEVANAPEGGVVARVVVPFQLAPAEWAGEPDEAG